TGATTINGGTLTVTEPGNGSSVISSSSALALGGGTLNLVLTNNVGQTFNGTSINSGSSSIAVSGGGGVTPPATLGAISRQVGGTVDFGTPTITSGVRHHTTTTTANSNFTGGSQTILGGYATVDGITWAVSAGNGTTAGNITGLATYNTGFAAGTNVNATTGTSTPGAMTIN